MYIKIYHLNKLTYYNYIVDAVKIKIYYLY